jgi:hypothetical protein
MIYLYHLLINNTVARRIGKVLSAVVLLFSYIRYREATAVREHKQEAAAKDVTDANKIRKAAAKVKARALDDVATRSNTELDAELLKRKKLRD